MEEIKKYLQDKKGIQCIAEKYTDDYIHITNTVHIPSSSVHYQYYVYDQ